MLIVWSTEPDSGLVRSVGLTGSVKWVTGENPPNPEDSDIVLCLGKWPLEYFTGIGVLPKNRTITSLRPTPFKAMLWRKEVTLAFSYSVNIGSVDYGKWVDLQIDLSRAFRFHQTGSFNPVLGDYQYVPNLRKFCNQLQGRIKAGENKIDVALDLETLGLDPYALQRDVTKARKTSVVPDAYIITIQASQEIGKSEVVYFKDKETSLAWLEKNRKDLEWLLTTPEIFLCGANLKYDLHWLHHFTGLYCTNFRFDTTLVGSLLDENRSNGLDIHAKIYAPDLGGYSDEFDRSIDKSRMDLVPKELVLPYAGGDTDAVLRVKQKQREELLRQPALARFYVNILHPAARAFEKVEQGGIHVSAERFLALEEEVNAEVFQLVGQAKRILGGRILAKHGDDSRVEGINLTKASLLNDYMFSPMGLNLRPRMFTEKTGAPSTAMEHLLMFADVPEAQAFVGLLGDYSSATKTLSTYIHGFRKHLRSDGRFHPSFWLFAGNKDSGDGGTVTGRLSARDPAFQTIPKHTKWGKKLRSCYTAPEGYVVVEKDYAQGELKVVACVAEEHEMISTYLNHQDLHAKTAGTVTGRSYADMMALAASDPSEYDRIRQYGKPVNFGLLYGMSAAGLVIYAKTTYGVVMTLEEAELFRHTFFELYPRLVVYHQTYKANARRHGQVVSPLGRIRHLPLIQSRFQDIRSGAERQAINSPIQSTLSDMLIWSIALSDAAGITAVAPCFGAIHDATYNYVPEDRVDELVQAELEIMENLPFHKVGWNPQLKFTADAKVGPSMGELSKYKPKGTT